MGSEDVMPGRFVMKYKGSLGLILSVLAGLAGSFFKKLFWTLRIFIWRLFNV